jgi:hypothetical protein
VKRNFHKVSVENNFINYRCKNTILVGKHEDLRRPRHRWDENIKMDLREVVLQAVDWIGLAQNITMAGSCEHGDKPSDSMEDKEFLY